jgi:hypothetical protein
MPGHLFIVQADLTRLEVDALAIPTDPLRAVEPSWLKHAPGSLRSSARRTFSVGPGDVVRWHEWKDSTDDRAAYLVDVGRDEAQEPEWYARRAVAYLDAAVRDLPASPRHGRDRPLVGLPILGTRRAGAAAEAGGVVDKVVRALRERLDATDGPAYDVVLTVPNPRTFAACQQVRRRLPVGAEAGAAADLSANLAAQALQKRLVVFLGAGVSMAAGLPSWSKLVDRLAARSSLTEPERAAISHVNLLDRARIIADAFPHGGIDLGTAIKDELSGHRYALGHSLLASLPVDEVVTTNYDDRFENAARDAGRRAYVLPYDAVPDGQRWLLKMHGTVLRPDDIVLTREDYLDYGRTRGALLGIVQALLITRHMLFVGFSLDDENFIRVAHDVRSAIRHAEGRPDRTFGTVLTLLADEGRRRLWQRDFTIAPMVADPAPERTEERKAQARQAARQIEIVLDGALANARPQLSHLLDDAFDGAIDETEQRVRDALETLEKSVGPEDAWQPVRDFLAGFRQPFEDSTAPTSRSTDSSHPSSSGAVGASS